MRRGTGGRHWVLTDLGKTQVLEKEHMEKQHTQSLQRCFSSITHRPILPGYSRSAQALGPSTRPVRPGPASELVRGLGGRSHPVTRSGTRHCSAVLGGTGRLLQGPFQRSLVLLPLLLLTLQTKPHCKIV